MSNRRKFLALIGAAPIAAPVIAKEAAAAMGLSGPIGMSQFANGGNIGAPIATVNGSGSYISRLRDQILGLESGDEIPGLMGDAAYRARVLDADLAAMRSVSPAWAYRQQMRRAADQIRTERKEYLARELADAIKNGFS